MNIKLLKEYLYVSREAYYYNEKNEFRWQSVQGKDCPRFKTSKE
ncbi:hypothetical protein [Gemella sp. zg-1178]|nr:hypothetical protein [Gemella sp. zg-1178]